MKIAELIALLSNPALAFIVFLGIFSVTRLITTDSFPIFEKARNWIFERFPPDGYRTRRRPTNKKIKYVWQPGNNFYDITQGHWIGELVQCPWCAGFWVSVFATLFLLFLPKTGLLLLLPFAFRAGAGWLSKLTGH